MLERQVELARSPIEAERELSERFVNYTKMQILRVKQVRAALPPASHGGSIDARNVVSSGTRWFLENPFSSLLDEPPPGVKLQATGTC